MTRVIDAPESREDLMRQIRQLEAEMHEALRWAAIGSDNVQSVCMDKLEVSDLTERRDWLKKRIEDGYDVAARHAVITEPFRELAIVEGSR